MSELDHAEDKGAAPGAGGPPSHAPASRFAELFIVGFVAASIGMIGGVALRSSTLPPSFSATDCPGSFRAPERVSIYMGDYTISCDDRGCNTSVWHGEFKTVPR